MHKLLELLKNPEMKSNSAPNSIIWVQVIYLQFNTFETSLSRYNSEVSAISRNPQVAVLPVEYSEDYVLWT